MERGTPFALAHTFRQTGPFRPANVDRRVPGLVFVGSGTVPGVGVPMVLLSGKAGRRASGPLRPRGSMTGGGPLRTRRRRRSRHARGVLRRLPALNRRHGTTYYWSTILLPRVKRHHVHALYAFCRYADEIVDEPAARRRRR